MPNSFPLPFAASDLADPSRTGVGDDIKASTFAKLSQSLNYIHAYGCANVVVSQTWADPLCAWDDGVALEVCTWRVPVLSSAHTKLSVIIRAKSTGNGGWVHFNLGGSSITIPVEDGGDVEYHTIGDRLTSAGVDGYDEIKMSLEAAAASTITVEHVCISIDPLTTPLDDGPTDDGYTPVDLDYMVSDDPLETVHGHSTITSMLALLHRPRVLYAWSGLKNVQAYAPGASETMDRHTHHVWTFALLGALDEGVRYRGFQRLTSGPGSADETSTHMVSSGLEDDSFRESATENEIVVPGALATLWYELDSIKLHEGEALAFEAPGAAIGLHPSNLLRPGDSTAGIESASMWGA